MLSRNRAKRTNKAEVGKKWQVREDVSELGGMMAWLPSGRKDDLVSRKLQESREWGR